MSSTLNIGISNTWDTEVLEHAVLFLINSSLYIDSLLFKSEAYVSKK